MKHEAIDWFYCFVMGAFFALLVIGSVIGHAFVSAGIAP